MFTKFNSVAIAGFDDFINQYSGHSISSLTKKSVDIINYENASSSIIVLGV